MSKPVSSPIAQNGHPDHCSEATARGTQRATNALVYLGIVVAALLAGLIFHLRIQGVFACPATGYDPDRFLADCSASGYGDYDHGAFWFDLEPAASQAAARAEVLFIGNSRMQFALSTTWLDDWFRRARIPYFLLGFSDSETDSYTGHVLARLQPQPRAVVINVDRFFDATWMSRSARELLRDREEVQQRYRMKGVWQKTHRYLCSRASFLCGDRVAVYRSRQDGSWEMRGNVKNQHLPVSDGPDSDRDRWEGFVQRADAFVSRLPVRRECIILTTVPTVETRRAEARAIALALGLPLVEPEVDALVTFDGSHLDESSAERWSAAFIALAGPRLQACSGR